MIRIRAVSGFTKAALGASLLTLLAVACDEEGKTVPARCVEGVDQPIFDIKTVVDGGGPPDYSAIPDHDFPVGGTSNRPCITNTGHAISPVPSESAGSGGTATGGTSNGGANAGGTDGGGAPAGGSDAGAGGS
jgi:hypothetical protein